MKLEIEQLNENGIWKVILRETVSANYQVLGCKWVFHYKSDGIYKCRWVVKGYKQIEGFDYQEIYANIIKTDFYRLMLALSVINGWIVENIDIETAFLNGVIDHDIYVDLPDGQCGKLLKSLYGLK